MNKNHIERRQGIPTVIMDLGLNNPIIRKITNLYLSEQIITKEEMFCQIIVELNKNWDAEQQRYYQMYMMLYGLPVPVERNA